MKKDVTYKLSTDYDRLYELLCDGQEVVCWIDYAILCLAKKYDDRMEFLTWGERYMINHLTVSKVYCDRSQMSEIDYLKKRCKEKSVEFFDPQKREEEIENGLQ